MVPPHFEQCFFMKALLQSSCTASHFQVQTGRYAIWSIPCPCNGGLFRRVPTGSGVYARSVRLAAPRTIQRPRSYRLSPGPTLCSVRCRVLFLFNAVFYSAMTAHSIMLPRPKVKPQIEQRAGELPRIFFVFFPARWHCSCSHRGRNNVMRWYGAL